MKQFLNYYRMLTHGPTLKSLPVGTIIAVAVLYLINILGVGDGSGIFPFLATFSFFIGIVLFCAYGSPNLEAVFPIGHKKKLLFRFLSSVFSFIIALVCGFTVIMIIQFIIWIFEPAAVYEFADDCKSVFDSMGVYGGLFGLAYLLVMYSSGMIAGFLKRRKMRNIFLACLCIGVFLFYLITALCYNSYSDAFSGPRLPYAAYYYECMRMPWLFLAFCFLIAAGMLGWAIYLGVKHYNPKKF
ncbi:MAG: hypothetical protein K2N23_00690 [Clostridia bacterium]|nr:hypothetical protein [Clostridia bacterium]